MTLLVSTSPKTLDLEIYGGDSFSIGIEFTDTAGNPWPIEGTWEAQIRTQSEIVDDFLVDTAEMIEGKLTLALTPEQTSELAAMPGCYHGARASTCGNCLMWDLEQSFEGGPRTWYRGSIHTVTDITRVTP